MAQRLARITSTVRDVLSPPPPPPGSQTVFITANWGRAKIQVNEDTTNQPLVVVLDHPAPYDLYLGFSIAGGGTAVRGTDYTLSGLATLPDGTPGDYIRVPAGQFTGFIVMSVPVEGGAEGTEFSDLQLEAIDLDPPVGSSIAAVVNTGTVSLLRVTIAEAPVAPPGYVSWSFESPEHTFSEGQPPATTRVRVNFSAPLPDPVTMRFYTTAITATAPQDFVAIDAIGTLSAGTVQFSIPLQIIDDTLPEGAETFLLTGEVINGPCVNGLVTQTTITIPESDQATTTPLVSFAVDAFGSPDVTLTEGAPQLRVRVLLSAPAPSNLFIPCPVVPVGAAVTARLHGVFPGGTFGQVVVQTGRSFADVFFDVPAQAGVQPTMEFDMTIQPGSGYEVGTPDTVHITALDSGAPVPEVQFVSPTIPLIAEGGSDVVVPVSMTDGLVQTEPYSVQLEYFGGSGTPAVYGQDFKVFQYVGGVLTEKADSIDFPAAAAQTVLVVRPVDNAIPEPNETYQIRMSNPIGCTIGAQDTASGEILDNDVGTGGTQLRPQFYFASEVFGQGPSTRATPAHRLNIIADLGPGITFGQDVLINLSWYGDSVAESLDGGATGDFWFPDGKTLRIPAGQRFGKLAFQALAAGLATTQRYVVVEMASTNFGQVGNYDQQCKWVAVLLGATDVEGLVPPTPIPVVGLDDFQVYANRIEVIAPEYGAGLTIPLPFDRNKVETVAVFGTLCSAYGGYGTAADLDNGVAIAAHLAQHLWLQRNGGSFGTVHAWQSGFVGEEEIHYIEPAVRWLTRGVPVYISVYEQANNGPHPLLFAGDSDTPSQQRPGSICWGRTLVGPSGSTTISAPSCTRDLYITARGHYHKIKEIRFGVTQEQTFAPGGQSWRRQAFTDNVHLIGFQIDIIPGGSSVLWPFIENQPPLWTTHQKLHAGIRYIDGLRYESTDPTVTINNTRFHARLNGPGSWVVTNCVGTRVEQHFFYMESTGPVCVFSGNDNPVGTGRTHLQHVARTRYNPGQTHSKSGAGPSHGLLAVVGNTIFGDHRWGEAGDFHIYGHTGYVFIRNNHHVGEMHVPGVSLGFNRRMCAILADGNEDGLFLMETTPLELLFEYCDFTPSGVSGAFFSQTLWATKFAQIADEDINLDAVGEWFNDAYSVAGCYLLDFLPVFQAVSPVPMNPTPAIPGNGRNFIALNETPRPRYELGAICSDPLQRPISGGAWGPEVYTPNRGGVHTDPVGGVRFPSGFAASLGAACGSTRLAQHRLFAQFFQQVQEFRTLTTAQQNAYDGRDVV